MAASAVEFDETTRTLALGRWVQVFEDVKGEATIEQVSAPAMQAKFVDQPREVFNAGYSRSAFWLKLDLLYSPTQPHIKPDWLLELAYPPIDHVDLYTADQTGRFQLAWQTGDRLPFASRQISLSSYVFDLNLKPGQTQTLYLRLASHGSIQVPLALWSSHGYIEAQPGRIYLLGLIYGILLGMLVYNLFIYLGMRDPSYVYCILYSLSYGLYQFSVNGAGVELFWPNNPWWANAAPPFLVSSAVLFASQFSRCFLQTPSLHRWLDRVLLGMMALAGAVIVLAVSVDYGFALRLATALALLFSGVAIVAGITAALHGLRIARYFIAAWTVFLTGSLVSAAMLIGYLPNNLLTLYSNQVGSVLCVALLSLALADRINVMREQQAQGLLKARQDLERLNQQLAASNGLKDEFLATLTHELRTPMNGVIGSLELMQMMPMDNQLDLYQKTAARSAQDMMGMVNDILTLTELQACKIYPIRHWFSVHRLVSALRSQYVGVAQAKRLAFSIELDEQLPDALFGDVDKLQQCVSCLLDNAFKFTTFGTVRVRITGHAEPSHTQHLQIDVSDSGIGFSRTDEAALYQNFFQIDGSRTRAYGGLGIGLAICRRLIELLGGSLSHQSVVGEGSCFTLRLELGRVRSEGRSPALAVE